MSEDAGLDIDFDTPPPAGNGRHATATRQHTAPVLAARTDRELAAIQGRTAGVQPGTSTEKIQNEVTGEITPVETVEFLGRSFRIADRIGLMPLLKFSAFADVDVQDARAMGAMYAMLRDCIHAGNPGCGECGICDPEPCGTCRGCTSPGADADWCIRKQQADKTQCKAYDRGDWIAFEDHAMNTKADANDLMDVITKTIELIAGRPTQQPSTSSAGRHASSAGSTENSSGRRGKGSRR